MVVAAPTEFDDWLTLKSSGATGAVYILPYVREREALEKVEALRSDERFAGMEVSSTVLGSGR